MPPSRKKRGLRPDPSEGLVLSVTLEDLPHRVHRELHVSGGVTLALLHDVLQESFGWTSSHLYSFEVGDVVFALADLDEGAFVDAEAAPLGAVCVTGSSFRYLYDFGDGWRHVIEVQGLVELPEDLVFRCVAGEACAPPEDVGGPPGFAEFLAAFDDPKHPEHASVKKWAPHRYDPRKFDLAAVAKKLAKLRREVLQAARDAEREREVRRAQAIVDAARRR